VAVVTDETQAEAGGRYIDFLIPGLIGMNLMGSSLWGIGYAVVDTRKRKLLKRFAATPMARWHFLFAFIAARLVFLAAEVGVLLLFARLAFDVPLLGSWWTTALVCGAGALSFAGLAVLIAARPESTEVASGWMNFVMLPMYLLSGSFFSYERFPSWLQPLIRVLPLTALNDALRAVLNEGAGLLAVAGPLLILMAWGGVAFALAVRWFRWS
jgi:ABC-type multidrug transport system permease subunit